MKNYYYFLGIESESTLDEIKSAYRKLSHKYHPDKNSGDPFFNQRFTDLKEAYEILSDPESRAIYDSCLEMEKQNVRSPLPPVIKSFTVNKLQGEKGEQVILKWNTQHADVVKLVPFGLVKSFGEKSVELPEFTEGQFQILLHAQNTLLRNTVVKGITIHDKTHVLRKETPFDQKSKEKAALQKKRQNNPQAWVGWLVLLLILALLALYLFY